MNYPLDNAPFKLLIPRIVNNCSRLDIEVFIKGRLDWNNLRARFTYRDMQMTIYWDLLRDLMDESKINSILRESLLLTDFIDNDKYFDGYLYFIGDLLRHADCHYKEVSKANIDTVKALLKESNQIPSKHYRIINRRIESRPPPKLLKYEGALPLSDELIGIQRRLTSFGQYKPRKT